MPALPSGASLAALQAYVAQWELEKGFAQQSATEKCLLLGEEIGELFKAVRASSGLGIDPISVQRSVGEELADVLMYLLALANRHGVDMEAALRLVHEKNERRAWS